MSTEQPQNVSMEEPAHHRNKRLKTEKANAQVDDPTTEVESSTTEADDTVSDTTIAAPTAPTTTVAKKPVTAPKRDVSVFEMAKLAAEAAREPKRHATTPLATPTAVDKRSRPAAHTPCRFGGHNVPASGLAAPDVDFSSAPSDPTELALWVAKQISNFGDGARDSVESDTSPPTSRQTGHPPAIYNRRFDDDDDPTKVAERERVREENRERKKRWRESNAERSMSYTWIM
jgi:hypothetical protein